MPRRLVCVAPGQFEWEEFARAPLRSGEVRIRPEFAAAKHGTEAALCSGVAFARGQFDPATRTYSVAPPAISEYPFAVGNMVVGIVVETTVPFVLPLDVRVCAYGGFADEVVAPAATCRQAPPFRIAAASAVCLDPAVFACAALRDGHVRLGDTVVVFGLGAIGLMAVQLALRAGVEEVIGVDPVPARRHIAGQLGASLTLDPTAEDVGLVIKQVTRGRGADVVIEYSGSVHAMQAALRGVAYGGTVVMGAFPAPYGPGLDLGAEAHMNLPKIVFTRACSQPDRDHPRWDESRIADTCWQWLCEGRLTGGPIVTPTVPFDSLAEEYPNIALHPERYIKLGATVG